MCIVPELRDDVKTSPQSYELSLISNNPVWQTKCSFSLSIYSYLNVHITWFEYSSEY